jgi:integrase
MKTPAGPSGRKPTKKPAPIELGPITLRALDGEGDAWRWRAEWYPEGGGGKMVTKALAQKRGERITKKEALARGSALLAAGAHLSADAPASAPAEVRTIRDLLECWVGAQQERPDLRDATKQTYGVVARGVVSAAGEVQLDRVTLRTLEQLRDKLGQTFGPTTLRQHLVILRIAWRWGFELGFVGRESLPRMTIKIPPKLRHTPAPSDVAAVLEHLNGWHRLCVALAWATGARISEVALVQWSDIDLERATITVTGKTGPRVVPLGRGILARLGEVPPDARVGPIAPVASAKEALTGRLREACGRAGVPPFTVHGMRRLAVDQMLASGVDIGTAAAITGHSPAVMLSYYRQSSDADRRRAVASAGLGELPAAPGKVLSFPKR